MDVTSLAQCPLIQIPGLPPWVGPAACVGYMLLEAWLGKTDKLEAGSVAELVLNVAKKAFVKKP